jgi:uncharacterized oligopeptide transporter (OPT) family protein
MAQLMTHPKDLADNVLGFCVGGAVLASLLPILVAIKPNAAMYLPSAIPFAIAFYVSCLIQCFSDLQVTPNWTLARVAGSFAEYLWRKKWPMQHNKYMVVVASGFVLGEGITSIFLALLKTVGVPVLSCAGVESGCT